MQKGRTEAMTDFANMLTKLAEIREYVRDSGLGEYGYVDGWSVKIVKKCDEVAAELTKLQQPDRPRIVCLCGSTRFYQQFKEINYQETMAGNIVLSVGFAPTKEHGETIGCSPEQKELLDQVYLKKIELADEIFVINVGRYVGESTAREIKHAVKLRKKIRWLEHDAAIDAMLDIYEAELRELT